MFLFYNKQSTPRSLFWLVITNKTFNYHLNKTLIQQILFISTLAGLQLHNTKFCTQMEIFLFHNDLLWAATCIFSKFHQWKNLMTLWEYESYEIVSYFLSCFNILDFFLPLCIKFSCKVKLVFIRSAELAKFSINGWFKLNIKQWKSKKLNVICVIHFTSNTLLFPEGKLTICFIGEGFLYIRMENISLKNKV